jgi:hypothetical protein
MESQGTQSTSEDKVICGRFLSYPCTTINSAILWFPFVWPFCPVATAISPGNFQLFQLPPAGWAHRNTGNITPGAKEWNDTNRDLPIKKGQIQIEIYWSWNIWNSLDGKTYMGFQPCTNGRFMTLCFHTTGITCYFSLLTCKLRRSCRDSKEMVDHINLPAYFIALGVLVHVLYVL